jgi:hypothetical protein
VVVVLLALAVWPPLAPRVALARAARRVELPLTVPSDEREAVAILRGHGCSGELCAPPPYATFHRVSVAVGPPPIGLYWADLHEMAWLRDQGLAIEAIERVRELTGMGLPAALRLVQRLPSVPPAPPV